MRQLCLLSHCFTAYNGGLVNRSSTTLKRSHMLSWFLNPWMLLGTLAVASPILIHLLNKRRFKIVDWAAMDFLFAADKKNRRRVQLENFILLLLRCLAMLLLALMLARPFLPSNITAILAQAQKVERVILIDDSLSQRVLNGSRPAIETAKESVKELISQLAGTTATEDWLTVILTSAPDQRLIDNEPLTTTTLNRHLQTIDGLQSASQVADYTQSLTELKTYIGGDKAYGRAAYVFTDLRQRDWLIADQADENSAPNKILQSTADLSIGTFVIDVAGTADQNLAITNIRADGLLVANKVINFIVDVANFGDTTIADLKVLLQVDQDQPQYQTVPSIAPGQTRQLVFAYVFNPVSVDNGVLAIEDDQPNAKSYRVRAEIDRQSLTGDSLAKDQLSADSARLLAASVIDGISVLLVDGDPSATSERSETHYLRSLNVLGTGLKMTTGTISDLETASLSDYSVIFLANVDEASADRTAALGQWVRDGGSLVMMPGNRVRAATFNATFFSPGGDGQENQEQGLSPIKLKNISGDPTMSNWANFEVSPQIHPALEVVIESDASSLGNVDVFSWWSSELPETAAADNSIEIPLRLNDADNSIAMVDRSLGDGRVVVFTIPGDGDWSMWPSSPTFAPVMVDLISYLAGSANVDRSITLGGSATIPIDLSAYENRVVVRDPQNEKMETVAKPIDSSNPDSIFYQAEFENLSRRGFYDVQLTRHSGVQESVLLATNYDARESRLTRLTQAKLDDNFFGDKVSLVSTTGLLDQTVEGGNSELWVVILIGLMAILVAEQFLGWLWGRKR